MTSAMAALVDELVDRVMERVTPHIAALVAEQQHHCQQIKPAVLTTRQAGE